MKTKSASNQFLILISVVLVCFFVLGIVGTIILSSVSGIGLKEMADPSKLDLTKPVYINMLRGMQAIQFVSLFVAPTFICTWLFSRENKKYLGLKAASHPGYIIAGVGVMLIAIPFTGWLGELNRNIPFPEGMASWMHEQEVDAARTIQALLSRHTLSDLLLNPLCVAGFAAVGEELLFRGMVQRLLIKMFKNPFIGILVSAALFSAMHMQFYGFFPRLALGILLGLIYWYSGSLWVAMLAHFIYDAVLIILAYNNPSMLADESSLPMKNLILAGSISFLFVILLLTWMRKKSVTSFESVYAGDAVPVKNHPFDFDKNTPE
jgi:hypothetical protein